MLTVYIITKLTGLKDTNISLFVGTCTECFCKIRTIVRVVHDYGYISLLTLNQNHCEGGRFDPFIFKPVLTHSTVPSLW